MKKLLTACLLFAFYSSQGQSNAPLISFGTLDSIYSHTLNETRKLWIYVPETDTSIYYSDKYPVVYLLDGDAYFLSMATDLYYLNIRRNCPKMIIVGIVNESIAERTRDFTPSHVTSNGPDSSEVAPSGGAENFSAFIEKELMPYIESKYPASNNRMLVGHSDGGLFVVNTLTHHSNLFNYYVALDPSLWWDNRKLLNETEQALQKNNFDGKMLYLAIANTLEGKMDTTSVKKDSSDDTKHIRTIFKFRDDLEKYNSSKLKSTWKYYADENHPSVPVPGEYDALKFFFKGYRFEFPAIFDDAVTAEKAKQLLMDHYKKYNTFPPEPILNALGYNFLNQKSFEKSKTFFLLEAECYPKSFNAVDSLGDYYIAINEKQKAKESYEKALALKFHPDTKAKLDKLKSEQ